MKLSKRLHNISLNLHTISGIALCVVLFVIFYCGAFSLFKKDIENWESKINSKKEIPVGNQLLDQAYTQLYENGNFNNREILISQFDEKSNFNVSVAGDSLNKREFFRFVYSLKTHPKTVFFANILYHVHYLRPIPTIGKYLAGFIALFFVFSIISGVLLQLKKIFNDFFLLRKKKKKLTFLKDSHIVFGIITLPYQLMYAVTGGVFCLLFILIIPQVLIEFNGDTSKMENILKIYNQL
jgi:uncharacterized iron-regulated membrane protein